MNRHPKRAYYCSCGFIVRGLGASIAHRAKHERANDGHDYRTLEWWHAHGQPFLNHPRREQRRPVLRASDGTPP